MAVKKGTTAPKAAAVKETAAKTEVVKAEKVEKAAAPKKAAAKTAKPAKAEKAEVSQNVYIQFAGKEILTAELLEQAKKAWVEAGHRASSIKSLDLYVKPEDSAAYYVINGKETGKVEL